MLFMMRMLLRRIHNKLLYKWLWIQLMRNKILLVTLLCLIQGCTVLGMVKVFQNMSKEKTFEIASLSGGIMEAMITTVGGLIVGIIAYMAYNYLVSKVEKVIHNMEGASLEFLDILEAPGK